MKLNNNTIKAEVLAQAHFAGKQYADNLRVGDRFIGASPAAIELGYERDTPEYRMFLHAVLDVLEHAVISVDVQTSKIVRLVFKSRT